MNPIHIIFWNTKCWLSQQKLKKNNMKTIQIDYLTQFDSYLYDSLLKSWLFEQKLKKTL